MQLTEAQYERIAPIFRYSAAMSVFRTGRHSMRSCAWPRPVAGWDSAQNRLSR